MLIKGGGLMNLKKCKVLWCNRDTIAVLIDNKFCGHSHTYNIKTLEDHRVISWFHHDVFNKDLEDTLKDCLYYDADNNYLDLYAPIKAIYDLNKVKELSETKEFKNEDYSFFDYEQSQVGMSGLFRNDEDDYRELPRKPRLLAAGMNW